MKSDYRGYYLCLDKDGQVQRVHERYEGGSVVLSWMNKDGVSQPHIVMKGRQAKSEVVIVYGFRAPEFISVHSVGSEHEKQLIERYQRGDIS